MALKDILVHLDTTPRCAVRLELAARLAIQHSAHLIGVHVIDIPSAKAHFRRHREHHLGDLVTRLNWRAMSSRRDSLVRNVKAVSLGRSSFQ